MGVLTEQWIESNRFRFCRIAHHYCLHALRQCFRPCVRDYNMFPWYLKYPLLDFRQTFVIGASLDKDRLIMLWGQKVIGQGHIIATEAPCTRRCRRFQNHSTGDTLCTKLKSSEGHIITKVYTEQQWKLRLVWRKNSTNSFLTERRVGINGPFWIL